MSCFKNSARLGTNPVAGVADAVELVAADAVDVAALPAAFVVPTLAGSALVTWLKCARS